MSTKTIRIGGASGYWGESAMATPQLLKAGGLDYIVYDYLAEITMSIMARAKAKDPNAGYAADFISAVLTPNIGEIARQGVKIVSNAGGLNPAACGAAVRSLIRDKGLDLKVAVIAGDDLTDHKDALAAAGPREMFSGADFPPADKIASINAYIGAAPIAKALGAGADIVIVGRCVDSAVTLGACMHEFGWAADDWDRLASGALAGHILECGPQATGGNFTDWREAGDIAEIGYPIAEIAVDGSFVLTKPEGTGGVVNRGTVCEQLVYEIGDPQAYLLPDVVCDFSMVAVSEEGANRVRVSPAKGRPAPASYKTCLTYEDGFRAGLILSFTGIDAEAKAKRFADAAFARARKTFRQFNAGDFTETSVEIIGANSQYGDAFPTNAMEVAVKVAARHPDAMGAGLMLKELSGLGLATPPGLSIFAGGRPKPSPVIRLFSYLTPKDDITVTIDLDGETLTHRDAPGATFVAADIARPAPPEAPATGEPRIDVPLVRLAWGRSGDKGDKANIGVIARDPAHLPYLWETLTEDAVARRFAHFIEGGADASKVRRYHLPGVGAINFLIDDVLGGGGVASLRNDPQGKAYAQILLTHSVPIPESMAKSLS